jgi:hypothetical protein
MPDVVAPKLVDMIAPDYDENGMRYDFESDTLTAL